MGIKFTGNHDFQRPSRLPTLYKANYLTDRFIEFKDKQKRNLL